MYKSTRQAPTSLYPKVSPGGFFIIDDYGAIPACQSAVDAYRAEFAIGEPLTEIDWTRGVLAEGLVMKGHPVASANSSVLRMLKDADAFPPARTNR